MKKEKDDAAEAMGVGLPEMSENPVVGNVAVHERPLGDQTEAHLKRGEQDEAMQLRWVSTDPNRDRIGEALNKGYVPVKAEEAKVVGIHRGHKGPDGVQRWGSELMLMKIPKRELEGRKTAERVKRESEMRRMKERLADDAQKQTGDRNSIIGDVSIRRG